MFSLLGNHRAYLTSKPWDHTLVFHFCCLNCWIFRELHLTKLINFASCSLDDATALIKEYQEKCGNPALADVPASDLLQVKKNTSAPLAVFSPFALNTFTQLLTKILFNCSTLVTCIVYNKISLHEVKQSIVPEPNLCHHFQGLCQMLDPIPFS